MKNDPHRRAIWAWTMYDWANSAFATTIMAAVLPVYYASVAAADLPPTRPRPTGHLPPPLHWF